MNRDEAKKLVEENKQGNYLSVFSINSTNGLIDMIYDELDINKCDTCLYKPDIDKVCWLLCIHNKLTLEDCYMKEEQDSA